MLLSLWILLGHYCSFPPQAQDSHLTHRHKSVLLSQGICTDMRAMCAQEGIFTLLLGRGYVAVQGFIILSGFITQYAYRDADYSSRPEVWRYYARRFGSILAGYYFFYARAMALGQCSLVLCA